MGPRPARSVSTGDPPPGFSRSPAGWALHRRTGGLGLKCIINIHKQDQRQQCWVYPCIHASMHPCILHPCIHLIHSMSASYTYMSSQLPYHFISTSIVYIPRHLILPHIRLKLHPFLKEESHWEPQPSHPHLHSLYQQGHCWQQVPAQACQVPPALPSHTRFGAPSSHARFASFCSCHFFDIH